METEDLSSDMDKLKRDIQELRNDLAAIAGDIRSLGSAKGQDTLDRFEQLGQEALKRAAAVEERIGKDITEKPLTSVLAAFGIGYVIGKLLDRR